MSSANEGYRGPSSSSSARLQRQIPGFEILEQIGAGGMGVVYKARAQTDGQTVVLKVPQISGSDSGAERFRREAEALRSLTHPNIVRLRHFDNSAQRFFAMDFVEGLNLKAVLEEQARLGQEGADFEWIGRIFKQLAEALQACHGVGLQHRDVKPENIILTDNNERVVLVDFGLVAIDPRLRRETYETLTRTGQILGTPGYMAPEQLDNSGELGEMGPATDVWGFGATLYKALTGRTPFGEHMSFPSWVMTVLESKPEPVEVYNTEIPSWLAQLCNQCLRKEPEARPGFAEILRAFEQQRFTEQRPRRFLAALSSTVLLVALGLLFWVLSADTTAPRLELEEWAEATRAKSVKIRGRVLDEAPGHVLFGERKIPLQSDGSFLLRLDRLKEGLHEYSVRAVDGAGNVSEPRSVSVRVDRTAPGLELDDLEFVKGQLIFRGRVSEPRSSLSFAGQPVALRDQFFQFECRPEQLTELTFRVADELGNEAKRWPPNLFLLGGRFKTLRALIDKAPSGSTVLLRKGTHGVGSESLERDIRFLGVASRREDCRVIGRFAASGGVRLRFQSLSLESSQAGQVLVSLVEGAALEMRDCQFRGQGQSAIIVKGRASKRCSVVLVGCSLTHSDKSVIEGFFVDLKAKNTEFLSPSARLMDSDHESGLVTLKRSRAEFQGCALLRSPNHGLRLFRSTARLRKCRVEYSAGAGIYGSRNSQVEASHCQFVRNFWCAIQLWTRCHLTLKDSSMVKNGTTVGSHHARHALVIVDRSKAHVQGCWFEDHAAEVLVEGSDAVVRKCQYKGLRRGRFSEDGGRVDSD